MPDLYELLDLPEDADTDAIEERLREQERTWAHLARDSDPAVRGRAGQVLADLVQARETLLDPERRAAYDNRRAENPVPAPPPVAPPPVMSYPTGQFTAVPSYYPHPAAMAPMPRRRPAAAGAVLALSGALLITIATFMPWDPRLSGTGNYWDQVSSQDSFGADSLPGMPLVAISLVLVTLLWALYFASSTPNQGLVWALVGIAGSLLLLPIAFGSLGTMGGNDPYLDYYGVEQGTRPGPIFAVIGVLLVFTGNFTAIAQNASRTGS
ncbi:J domain-containing protein [Glycomyces artemisiae]|uniref:J domain-containing protein n=1 Tax=Glycomyces artemisiae TaxID=1076443 RepID=A0A2T0UML7_9ACTN|nr:hypothetical protein [Glycomyces artemisiae]PRY59183.1 hypothetical protein B0I28_104342 [Glycomyces artemisiae]